MKAEPKTYTAREVVERERKAFSDCIGWMRAQRNEHDAIWSTDWVKARDEYFPRPKVTRPREVSDPYLHDYVWSVRDGYLHFRCTRYSEAPWYRPGYGKGTELGDPMPERVALWADLLANPTETVEVEG